MKNKANLPKRLRYIYKVEPGVRINTVHGIWGGINGQGEIEVNFYTESAKFPEYSEQIFSQDGSLQHEITPDENIQYVVRNISNRLLLTVETAQAFIEWLEERINELEIDLNGESSDTSFNPGSDIKQ